MASRAEVFHKARDYQAFVDLLRQTAARVPIRLLAYCVMPYHFHAAVWPHADGDLGRFKAFPIAEDSHLLTMLGYVERNPLRAGLVARAEGRLWSSLRDRSQVSADGFVDPGPVALPEGWVEWVNQPQTDGELIPIAFSNQILPGTFEYILNYLIDNEVELSIMAPVCHGPWEFKSRDNVHRKIAMVVLD